MPLETYLSYFEQSTANDAISLADRALYNDLFIFNDMEQAMGNSFQAADRLRRESDVVFASSFIYVANIRLIILRAFDQFYYARQQFVDEFQAYTNHLDDWITQINNAITAAHTVRVERECRGRESNRQCHFVATHLRNGVVADTYSTDWDADSEEDRARVELAANQARDRGIAEDRRQYGVVDMESVAAAWRRAFMGNLRAALVSQVLNRPAMAIDSNPDGLMVDGRILPASLDLRSTLRELLCSREFRNRVQAPWDAFMNRGDDRLAQFAYRRLFSHDATQDEIALLRGVASSYGYAAFIAALLYCNEYEERYGRGLPGFGQPVVDALQFRDNPPA